MTTPIVKTTPGVMVSIIDQLNKLGIPASLGGYEYIKTGLLIALEDPHALQLVTKNLYPAIAKEHNTTGSRVERAIRHAIEVAFDKYTADDVVELYGRCLAYNKGKLTNSEFLAIVAEKIRINLGVYDGEVKP